MHTDSYLSRREQLTTYFDRTAANAWKALTSTDPVGRIRATVRQGRDDMRSTLLSWLPDDLRGRTLLDAGCGTGALSVAAAERGARVVAIDVAASLVDVARERAAHSDFSGSIDFRVGDMLGEAPSDVDYVVAMDSLIHYGADDIYKVITEFTRRAGEAVLFTAAPRTPPLALMHLVGRMIPHRSHRAPAIEPVRTDRLRRRLDEKLAESGWSSARSSRISSGFYISEALELRRPCAD